MAGGGVFVCSLCDLRTWYDYHGTSPPSSPAFVFSESCFVVADPFTPGGRLPVCLGAACSRCKRLVCVSKDCRWLPQSLPGGLALPSLSIARRTANCTRP